MKKFLQLFLCSVAVLGYSFTKIPSTDYPPQYLNGVAAAYDEINNQIIIFGGYNPNTKEYYSEIYTFSLANLYWIEIFPESDYIPPGLSSSNMIIYLNNVYIFKGKKSGGINVDVYNLNLESLAWKIVYLEGETIIGRLDCAFTKIEYNNTVYAAMFGGLTYLEVSNELIL